MLGIDAANPNLQEFFTPKNSNKTALGSGFIVSKDGHIITNNHVIENSKAIFVTTANVKQFVA